MTKKRKNKKEQEHKWWLLVAFLVGVMLGMGGLLLARVGECSLELKSTVAPNKGEEIERKWLIREEDIPYDLSLAERYEIKQTYLNYEPELRVREINGGESYTMGLKMNLRADGLIRDEQEYYLTLEEYTELVGKGIDYTIHKVRYQFLDEAGVTLAIDIFKDELAGLAYLEIEFDSQAAALAYPDPEWVVRDVTADKRYKNASLAQFGQPSEEGE